MASRRESENEREGDVSHNGLVILNSGIIIPVSMQLALRGITQRELHLSDIRNHYWHLRTIRPGQEAKRRKLYRRIAKIKAALVEDGFDPEELRLYCRQFTDCYRDAAQGRYDQYRQDRAAFDAYLQNNDTALQKNRSS